MQGARLIVVLLVVMNLGIVQQVASAEIRLYETTDAIMKACAIGRTVEVKGDVRGGITRWLKGVEASGSASISDLGAILTKIGQTDVGAKLYKIYTKCLKDQAEILLKGRGINITKEDIQSLKAKEFDWSSLGKLVWERIRVGRDFRTTVYIFDATCDIYVWLAEIIHGKRDSGIIEFKPTENHLYATSYPFKYTFRLESPLIREAFNNTHLFSESDRKAIQNLRNSEYKELKAILAFRTLQNNCGGKYYIEYSKM